MNAWAWPAIRTGRAQPSARQHWHRHLNLFALSPSPPLRERTGSAMNESRSFQIISDLYTAYKDGDLDAFYRDLHPEIVWIECVGFPTPGVFRSKEEIVDNVFSVLARDWSHWQYELKHLLDAGEFIVATGSYQGTHGKTGKSFTARAAHTWHVVDGKIIRFEQFADTHPMQSAATA
ncbi:ketosteroid isomerase-like protein [Streptomyces sp. V3I8]|uniref:nuclear transport factor 2 family protein n=1 Tax=Streptomyces sp. V3I8 TaxID=3042279 RepID=UPI00278133E0|nr:nuclear transport factor 2 family protein [Streptomyces sp. V3I8]MDQ1036853.1 ketosteroid isomerase-like protein [Streptomyces sp. V3I8]